MTAPAPQDVAPIALVSCRAYPQLSPDDQLLDAALRRVGWRTVTAIWDDPRERWQEYGAIVLRSCWDYHRRPQAFRHWLDHLEERARPFTPA